jgi:hypothetical protein
MTPQILTKFLYVRVIGFPHCIDSDRSFTTYLFSAVLRMHPGLHLDRLVVEDCYYPGDVFAIYLGSYLECEWLLKTNGWKELYYVSGSSDFLTWDSRARSRAFNRRS